MNRKVRSSYSKKPCSLRSKSQYKNLILSQQAIFEKIMRPENISKGLIYPSLFMSQTSQDLTFEPNICMYSGLVMQKFQQIDLQEQKYSRNLDPVKLRNYLSTLMVLFLMVAKKAPMELQRIVIFILELKSGLQQVLSEGLLYQYQEQQIKLQTNQQMSVTTPLQIKNHPLNTSTSKHHWSFCKANRFPLPKFSCSKSFYNHKSCLSERRASIGVGRRTQYFDGQGQVPEGGKYEACSDFDYNKHKKGFSFTANRQNLRFDHFQKTVEVTPEPSKYQGDSPQIKHTKYYSMRPKTAYPNNYFLPNTHDAEEMKKLPGPGKYQTIDTLGNKYYTKSTNHQGRSFVVGNRFRSEKLTPGPQDYPNKTIEPDGIYLLSNMKGSGRRSFLNGRRDLKLDGNKQTPGPGNYRLPSDFGHYEEPFNGFSTLNNEQPCEKRPSTAIN